MAYLPVLDEYFHLHYDCFLLCEIVLMLLMSACKLLSDLIIIA